MEMKKEGQCPLFFEYFDRSRIGRGYWETPVPEDSSITLDTKVDGDKITLLASAWRQWHHASKDDRLISVSVAIVTISIAGRRRHDNNAGRQPNTATNSATRYAVTSSAEATAIVKVSKIARYANRQDARAIAHVIKFHFRNNGVAVLRMGADACENKQQQQGEQFQIFHISFLVF